MMAKYMLIVLAGLLCHVASQATFCGGKTTFNDDFDTIELKEYFPSANCRYTINLNDPDRWIKLQWDSFKVDGDMPDCTKGYVEVKTGCGTLTAVARFCSNNLMTLPHDIVSPSGCMEINVIASDTASQFATNTLGFKATYTSGTDSYDASTTTCAATTEINGGPGVITSPRWPRPYENTNFPNGECQWQINAGSDDKILQVNLMDLTLPDSGSSALSNTCPAVPYVEIAGTKYCGIGKSALLTPQPKNTLVKMKVKPGSETNFNRGMALGYLMYTNASVTTPSPSSAPPTICVQWGSMAVMFMAVLFFR